MAMPNYQMLYQLNPSMFSDNASLADALYGPEAGSDFAFFKQQKAAGGPLELLKAQMNPAAVFPQATQYFSQMPQQGQAAVAGQAQQPQQFVAPRAPVMDPNNIPAPIFRYK